MSQLAMLLNRIVPPLPKGKVRVISSDRDRRHGVTLRQAQDLTRGENIRTANTERVYRAVAAGFDTIHTIADETDLSVCTVNRSLHDLEDWPGGPRIQRLTGIMGQKHVFRVIQEQAA